jgi:outer membrane protein assembly factor BamD
MSREVLEDWNGTSQASPVWLSARRRVRKWMRRPISGRGVVLLLLAILTPACASVDRYEGLDADDLYEMGVRAFEDEDWSLAVGAFERKLAGYPGHERAPEARMYLARAHVERNEFILAAAEFERFLQLHPMHGMAPEASLGACRAYEQLSPIAPRDQTYTIRAMDACYETTRQFLGLNVAVEAESIRFRMEERLAERIYQEGRFYQRRGGHDSAILVFEDVVREYPQTRWAPMAMLAMHRSYLELGWEEEASEEAERLLRLYPDSEAAGELEGDFGVSAFGGGVGGTGSGS